MIHGSGRQFHLRLGDYEADVASVGASLRALRWCGRDLVLPFSADEVRPAYRGAVIAPWPNRVVDGRWTWAGQELQLPLTEPARRHALHGLVAWTGWHEVDVSETEVALTTRIWPQPGYPFVVDLRVRWSLDERGLECELAATNPGREPAPYGCTIHPYLVAPHGPLESWVFELPAAVQLQVDERLAPKTPSPVPAEHDFRSSRAIGDAEIDHAYSGIDLDERGEAHAALVDEHGDGVRMTFGRTTPWVQVHTADKPGTSGHRAGLAVEPMTCPPGAFNSGTDVFVLQPGAEHRVWWRLAAISAGG